MVNTGSSSVQLQLIATADRQRSADDAQVLFSGKIENLKQQPRILLGDAKRPAKSTNHADGAVELLDAAGDALAPESIDVVVHRMVHGGARYSDPVRIDDTVLAELHALESLAPLHNTVARKVIASLRTRLPRPPHVAVFDTAFHATLPEVARTYGIAPDLAAKHGIRRYGFHGTAYRYMVDAYSRISGNPSARVVAVHLGGGCSVAAVDGGTSVETSMGMTPLEGLVMGTRSGDIDPGVIDLLAREEGKSASEIIELLNTRSGLRALSGTTEDTRELVKTMHDDPRAKLALEVFAHRIVKYIGAYLAVLGGAEALLLGGVINENTPWLRERVCRQFAWCGLTVDDARNAASIDVQGRISTDDSRLHAWVIPAREDLQLAFEAVRLIEKGH